MKWLLWGLTSSHMNTIGLIESTRVSAFQSYRICDIPKLLNDSSVQRYSNRIGKKEEKVGMPVNGRLLCTHITHFHLGILS